jgi:cytochrome c-type biogenesis protein CcmH
MDPMGSREQEPKTSGWKKPRIALLLAALIAAGAIGYAALRDGAPGSTDASTAAAGDLPLIDTLERQAADTPEDAATWQRLGQAYFDDSRFADAVRAYGRAADLDPKRAANWAMLGEAQVYASKTDPLPDEAVASFDRALALDPAEPRARYFMAVKKDLAGDHEGAIAAWLDLLADTPKGAVWETDLRRTIEQVGTINGIPVADRLAAVRQPQAPQVPRGSALPGPSAQDLAAASALPPSAQREMAEGMVARLEARLKSEPANLDGWIMLMRSRMTLGQPDRARAALRDAVSANPGQADLLRRQAADLGVPAT